MTKSNKALFLVSGAILLAASVWFTGTAAAAVLKVRWRLTEVEASGLTIAVQAGFIVGTLLYAVLNVADIFRTRTVFFASSLGAALFNAGFALFSNGLALAVVLRFLTGITLAGVYPVAMKIVAQWFNEKIGWRLGVMLGAMTFGTAIPHFLLSIGATLDWRALALIASGLCVTGGAVVLFVLTDGPYLKETPRFDPRVAFRIFKHRPFRLQAVGYFGHMWELYAFWALLGSFLAAGPAAGASVAPDRIPLVVFLVIAVGVPGCILGGWISRATGEKAVALVSLAASGLFCALSPFRFGLPASALGPLLVVWGFFVVSDSPQFSALATRTCPPEYTGTALTIQNGVGFAITVVSIPFIAWISKHVGWRWAFAFLTVGPLLGAWSLSRLKLGRG
jgi:MFS family permease